MHRSVRAACAAGAVLCLLAFFVLAHAVGRAPDPAWLLTWEASLVNHSTAVAEGFTAMGYAYVLLPLCVAAIVLAVVRPAWRLAAAVTIVALLLSWQGADFWQHVFGRPRRLDWVWKHETAYSFPSSHAAIATGFYAFWGWLLASADSRGARIAGVAALVVAAAIVWSRLALGAHYATDLLGGILWGAALVLTGVAAFPIKVLGRRTRQP